MGHNYRLEIRADGGGGTVNKLKSIFVLWYPVSVLAIVVSAAISMIVQGPNLAWSGALLTALPFLGLYIRATTSRTLARTSHSLPILSLLTVAGRRLRLLAE